jgi:uncharacterized protein YdcH (DUF465 family)
MHDPLHNPEIAAASQDRGGATELIGRTGRLFQQVPLTPRAACSRGVRIFGIRTPHSFPRGSLQAGPQPRQVHLPPPAPSRLFPAGLRMRPKEVSMFEGQPQTELEAKMKASPEFRQLYYRHQELDKQVLDAELGVLPINDTTLGQMKREKLAAKDRLLRMYDMH